MASAKSWLTTLRWTMSSAARQLVGNSGFANVLIEAWFLRQADRYFRKYLCLLSWQCMFSRLSCLALCNPMDYCPPGSSVHGILQARVLECVAISFSRGFSPPRDQTRISWCSWSRFFTTEPLGKPIWSELTSWRCFCNSSSRLTVSHHSHLPPGGEDARRGASKRLAKLRCVGWGAGVSSSKLLGWGYVLWGSGVLGMVEASSREGDLPGERLL